MKTTSRFETLAHAKCILSGEHAVLRGHPALVFPVKEKFIKLHFEATDQPIDVECFGSYHNTLRLIFWGILEECFKHLKKRHETLHGQFTLLNTIPMGAGLGFSAALCVAISRFIAWCGWIKQEELFEFSRQLEHYFHGKSSGIDIAGALCEQPTYFSKEGGIKTISLSWKPLLYLSHSNQISITAQCIETVNTLWENQATLANTIDYAMRDSVEEATAALTGPCQTPEQRSQALTTLASAIEKSHHCFEQWGLNKGELKRHIKQLKKLGALAAKSTGAGNGGYVISLWASPPPLTRPFELIPINI